MVKLKTSGYQQLFLTDVKISFNNTKQTIDRSFGKLPCMEYFATHPTPLLGAGRGEGEKSCVQSSKLDYFEIIPSATQI